MSTKTVLLSLFKEGEDPRILLKQGGVEVGYELGMDEAAKLAKDLNNWLKERAYQGLMRKIKAGVQTGENFSFRHAWLGWPDLIKALDGGLPVTYDGYDRRSGETAEYTFEMIDTPRAHDEAPSKMFELVVKS